MAEPVVSVLLLFWLATAVQPVLVGAVVAVERDAIHATSRSPSATPAGSVSVSGVAVAKAFAGNWRDGVPVVGSGNGLRSLNGPPA